MTKIFITIPWFLPAFRAGGPVQSIANLVKEFHEGVEYFIFCGDTDLNGAALENITTGKWVPFNEYTQVWYAAPQKISERLVRQIEKIKPDILYINGMFSWHFNMVPILFCKAPVKILSTRGMLHAGALSQKKWKKKIYLQAFKLLEYHHKVSFHATDEEEYKYISNYFGKAANIFTAGNFPNKTGTLPFPLKEVGSLSMASIALVSPMKNILLVLQALEKSEANIRYDIYGPIKDEAYWDLCKQTIKTLPENIRVHYHKEIEPHKTKEALASIHVFILPSKSENFGHAIYEALSAGRPVITSNNTPWNYLSESNAGINIHIDDKIKAINELSESIAFFASMDNTEIQKWHKGAVAYAEKAIDVEITKEAYAKMFLNYPSLTEEK
ncbi:MAG: glycosyltransferase [Bacteroidota bacterium]|nr:glycosyltransferase [Bacteroidota bacterium]